MPEGVPVEKESAIGSSSDVKSGSVSNANSVDSSDYEPAAESSLGTTVDVDPISLQHMPGTHHRFNDAYSDPGKDLTVSQMMLLKKEELVSEMLRYEKDDIVEVLIGVRLKANMKVAGNMTEVSTRDLDRLHLLILSLPLCVCKFSYSISYP